MTPFLSVTWPGPRWPMPPASTQAMIKSATIETMKGTGERLPAAASSSLVLPIAASHGLDRVM